jgi:hypothetical protein
MKRKEIILLVCCTVFLTGIPMAQTPRLDLNGQKWAFCGAGNQVDTSGLVGLKYWQGHYLLFDRENVTCSNRNDSIVLRNGLITEYFGQYALISDTLSLWFFLTSKSNTAGKVITAGSAVEPDGYTMPFKARLKIEQINATAMSVRVLFPLPIPYWRPTPIVDPTWGKSAIREEPVLITYYRIN